MGRQIGKITQGYQADLLVIDENQPQLVAREKDVLLDSLIFSGKTNSFKDVMVAGQWQVKDFHHKDEDKIASAYADVSKQLLAG
jgi:formimidoylglutamate deiminase